MAQTKYGTAIADGDRFTVGSQVWEIDYNASAGGLNFTNSYQPSSSFVTVTAVPEPSTYVMLANAGGSRRPPPPEGVTAAAQKIAAACFRTLHSKGEMSAETVSLIYGVLVRNPGGGPEDRKGVHARSRDPIWFPF